jgi:hypothetical protein
MLGMRDDSNANGREAMSQENMPQQVVVKDIRMTFGSMVIFMIKWSIAAIPAMIILGFIGAIIGLVFGGMFAGLGLLAS